MKRFCMVISFILLTKKLGKCSKRVCLGIKVPYSILVLDLLAIESKIDF